MNEKLNRTVCFLVPLAVLLTTMWLQNVSFDSTAAVAIVVAFMVMKVIVQYFKIEPGRALFAKPGNELQLMLYRCGIYCAMALATVELFVLSTL